MTLKHFGLTLLIIFLALSGGFLLTHGQTVDSTANVTQGRADLSNSEVNEDVMRLDGTWRFQSSLTSQVDRKLYRTIPHVTPHGVATYEVDVSLPNGQYALRVPRNHSHVRLTIDGQEVSPIYSSKNLDSRHAYLVLLDPDNRDFRITMQVSESKYKKAGIDDSILIGPISNMMTLHNKMFSYEFVIVLISLLIFIFYAIVSLLHRKESLYLYGTAFFFLASVALLTRDNMLIDVLIPHVSHVVLHKISVIAVLLSICMLIEFALRLEQVPFQRFLKFMTYPFYALSLVSVFLPYNVHSTFDYFIWVFILFASFFWAGLNINWLFERKAKNYPFELLIFTLALIIGYIGSPLNLLFRHANQDVYSGVISLIYFILMFTLLPIHLSTGKRQKLEVEAIATQSEISFFNSQIKPHFLYNTFGNVIALCYTSPDQAARLLSHLSTYVRFIFENARTNTDISLAQELEMIDSYLLIEQTRYNDAFSVIKNIDESLLDVPIPPLLIQPLIENAIRHGLMKKTGERRLMLSVQDVGNSIEIRVADNGVGFDTKAEPKQTSGIGLANVKSRIAYLSNASLKIQSEPGVGTHIQIRLPKQERVTAPNANDFD